MRKLFVLVLAVLLAACAAKETPPALGPHGGHLHPVDCIEPVDNCNLEAIRICPNGFNIVEALESTTIVFDSGIPMLANRYALQVECKP